MIKPILFNTDMVRAILKGRKTATRRVVKPQHLLVLNSPYHKEHPETPDKVLLEKLCEPPYRPGDILYVRETWTKLWYVDSGGYTHYDRPMYYYAADGTPDITLYDEDGFEQDDQRIRWRPSIHMPREAARIFLRVTNVYPQQLKDVTEADARAEGFSSRDEFMIAILKMYPDCTGDSWFWVIEFERCEKPEEDVP